MLRQSLLMVTFALILPLSGRLNDATAWRKYPLSLANRRPFAKQKLGSSNGPQALMTSFQS